MASQEHRKLQSQDDQALSVQDLKSQYKLTSLDLLECAQHIPGVDSSADTDVAQRESRLLSVQEDLLDQITDYDITSTEEATALAEFWTDLNASDDEPRPEDKLAAALGQFIRTHKAAF